ncbi:hypothetical protein ZIOFF_019305 [Zingiber officinale]|uniref:NADH dehydrogenase [ubiquinone] 1 alpha subcomplex subunit 13 n=1 Tax=Zingiber officinale TaxID=94328 RepID=A0A8J5HLT3_ZINOF|nr:hypothetical protein ZIOFF_019305 [Zingiber officinale]
MTEAQVRKKPGMTSVREMPLLQDGPPPGGFAPVRYARRIPSKGPSAAAIVIAAFGVISWGFYQVGQGNKIRRIDLLAKSLVRRMRSHISVPQKKDDSCSGLGDTGNDDLELLLLNEHFSKYAFVIGTSALKEEKYAARRALVPVLQAEEDERFVKEWKKYLEEEARIMKDVPGWKVGESVYNSGKWMPPATSELRPDVW